MKRLLRLYPVAWRSRYEAEMSALLGERPMRIGDAQDLVRGALDAHRHGDELGLTPPQEGKPSMSIRRAGWAAVFAGTLWITAYLGVHVVGIVAQQQQRGMSASEGSIFLLALLAAPACLGVAQAWMVRSISRFRRVGQLALVITGLGAGVMAIGLLANALLPDRALVDRAGPMSEPWVMGMATALAGSFTFGLLLLATGRSSRWVASLLMAGSLLNGLILIASTADLMTALRYSLAVALCGVLFGVAWIALGAQLLREPAPSESADIAIA